MNGGRCPYGGWQQGKKTQPGSIAHYCEILKRVKKAYGNKKSLDRMRKVDLEVNKRLRIVHKCEEIENSRKEKNKNKNQEEEEEEDEIEDDMD